MSAAAYCEECGVEVEYPADWCDKCALTNAELGELGRRVHKAMRDYRSEIGKAGSRSKESSEGGEG